MKVYALLKKDRMMMAKRRAIATEPRVLRLRDVSVYWED